jgi:restriction system protein
VQYDTNEVGKMDILAISKDKSEFLVIELKKDQVSDVTLGQVLRYMGHVKEQLAESHQEVSGLIIGLEHDIKLKRALRVAPNVSFLRYSVDFNLLP